jgi:HK97 family phage prohead protease
MNYTPPQAVQAEARRALKWIEEGHAGQGFTDVGRKRASDLARGASVSRETIGRIANYLGRHEVDKKGKGWSPGDDGYPSPGRVAWAAWGGDPAKSWTAGIMNSKEMSKRNDECECWDGYCRVPGTEMCEAGSCEKCDNERKTPGGMMSDDSDYKDANRKAPVEIRTAAIGNIDSEERIVTLIAIPYEQTTSVPFRGEVWNEVVERGAFSGIENSTHTFRVNRDHDKRRLVGKIVKYYPDREDGLVVDAYISKTELGDETLQLAKDGILGASVGMAIRSTDQVLERSASSRTRRIKRAFLDHLALVPDPAYQGAEVLAVRSEAMADEIVDDPSAIVTPRMNEFSEDPILSWMFERAAELRKSDD